MTLDFFDALEAIEFGAGLADEFASKTKSRSAGALSQEVLNRADLGAKRLRLSIRKRN